MELCIREVDFKAGARSKGSNGGVAVGLPHRNSSVFKQAHINQWKVKRIDPPSAVLTLTHKYFGVAEKP
jgi:hypothetical protein